MALTINTNAAATSASYYLAKNNSALQKSLTRLSSGRRINKPVDDAGGLAVSMKLSSSINRLKGVSNNIQNAISFLEVQDGILRGAADILNRMGELKALSQDVLKNSSDVANYNAEFQTLQQQLYQISNETFNGVSLFAIRNTDDDGDAIFGGTDVQDNTASIYTTDRGSAGSIVSIHKSALLSAVTFTSAQSTTAVAYGATNSKSLAADGASSAISLGELGVSFFTKALENVATLRAQNGGSESWLNYAAENAYRTRTNLEFANGRIIDVDIAAESTRLGKYNILVQASASMLSQANLAPNSALMLLN